MIFTEKITQKLSKKEVKKLQPIIKKVLSYENEYKQLADEEFKAKTNDFKFRLTKGETLDDILPEAFALCREAAYRTLHMRHYPVQIAAGIVLHQGRIAEVDTGQGKTLAATLPAYLNALTDRPVHVVTVNDYLAKRDAQTMGKIYSFLGLTTGLICANQSKTDKKKEYSCNIIYGTNNEFGFDYLRDNMAIYNEEKVQTERFFAIVDEVDSVLIDEARTPLIISGTGEEDVEPYIRAKDFANTLKYKKTVSLDNQDTIEDNFDCDYVIDEKSKHVLLTNQGIEKAEKYFKVDDITQPDCSDLLHQINQAIKAKSLMKRNRDYIISNGEVLIVDEHTGRTMKGRRFNDGLHQAIEAKENINVKAEAKTLATISFQNFFRLYEKLSGMTGTAMTEASEFNDIYHLDIVKIPTAQPIIRKDHSDLIFATEENKNKAIIELIEKRHALHQPILVGTPTIIKSEMISRLLKEKGIKHNVLNAKNNELEADIIAQAGMLDSVTIATNMAGRGTDIILGGNPEMLIGKMLKEKGHENVDALFYSDEELKEMGIFKEKIIAMCNVNKELVKEAGGLLVIGTERHESRRIDNQLRGRSGRQGDPGESQFFVSLEDEVIRLYGSDKIIRYQKSNTDEPITNSSLSKLIKQAQKNIESNHFKTRKDLLEYDDVINEQRKIIYKQRELVLNSNNCFSIACGFAEETEEIKSLLEWEETLGTQLLNEICRMSILKQVDENWINYITALDGLKESVWTQSYAQKQPIMIFKEETYNMFNELIEQIKKESIRKIGIKVHYIKEVA